MMKTISPRFMSTVTGALVGGALLEQDNDASGLAIGLGIGALTGYNFNVTLPDSHKMIYRDKEVILKDILSPTDKLKAEILEEIDNFTDDRWDKLPGQRGLNFDIGDVYGTLNRSNIRDAIKDAESVEDLRRIRIAMNNPEKFSYISNPKDLPGVIYKKNDKFYFNSLQDEDNMNEVLNKLRMKFSGMGYKNQELEEKMSIFKLALKDADTVIMDTQTDNVNVTKDNKTLTYKISSHHSVNEMSSYTDTNNFYSVRSLNPLARQLVADPELQGAATADINAEGYSTEGEKIAKMMGLDESKFKYTDPKTKEISQDYKNLTVYLAKNKWKGYQPEDLKAMLSATELYDTHENEIERWINSAYQHRQDESAYRAQGFSRNTIENKYTVDLTKRLSGQQSFERVFNIDRETGQVDKKNPFRNISHKTYDDKVKAEARRFRELLASNGGIEEVDAGKKADHNTIAANGKRKAAPVYNVLTPMERNPYTQSREVRTENLGKNSIANTFEQLKISGQIPKEFDTAIATKRLSVDEGTFNILMEDFNKMNALLTVSDGGSIASKQIYSNYNTIGKRTFKIAPDATGLHQYSEKVLDVMQKRVDYNLSANHTAFKPNIFNPVDKLLRKAEFYKEKLAKIQNTGLPPVPTPDPKFDPATMLEEQARRVVSANLEFARRNPGVYLDSNSRPITEDFARIKVMQDWERGVKAAALGYEGSRTAYERAIENRDLDIAKYQKKLEGIEEQLTNQIRAISNTVDEKIAIEGSAPILKGLSDFLSGYTMNIDDHTSLDMLRELINDYNSIAGVEFKPGEIIGINGNGTAVRLPQEFDSYRLESHMLSNQDIESGRVRGNLVFKGTNNMGKMDTVKLFAVDNKENAIFHGVHDFAIAQTVATFLGRYKQAVADESFGYGWKNKDGEFVFKKQNKNSTEYAFYDRETKKLVKFKHEDLRKEFDKIRRSISDNKMSFHSTGVGTISSYGNTGQKITARVADTLIEVDESQVVSKLKAIKNGEKTESSLSSALAEGLNNIVIRDAEGKVSSKEAWALGQMTTAFTEGKASMNALAGMKVLGTDKLIREVEDISNSVFLKFNPAVMSNLDATRENKLTDMTETLRGLGLEDSILQITAEDLFVKNPNITAHQFSEELVQHIINKYLQRVNDFEDNFSTGGKLAKFIWEGGFNNETANLFRYSYDKYNLSMMMASPDVSQGYATGSGKLGKTMSHIAQTQLLAGGMSKQVLSLFGEVDPQQLYDYKALTTLDLEMEGRPTLNSFLHSMVYDNEGKYSKVGYAKAKGLVESIAKADPEDINQILADYGADQSLIDEEFLRFQVRDNEHKLTNIPIYKHSTTRYGSFISDDEKVAGKELQKLTGEYLKQYFYLEFSNNGSKERVDRLTSRYMRWWTDTVGNSNNPMLKEVLALQAPNSSYSKVISASGERFGELIAKTTALNKGVPVHKEWYGKSVAGITRAKAAQMVQEYYGPEYKISDLSYSELREKYKTDIHGFTSIDDFIRGDNTRLLEVTTKEGKTIPLYTLLNREPSHSSFSISPYLLTVLSKDEVGNAKSTESIFIHKNDKHYTALMVGDFDNDHVLMYALAGKISNQDARRVEDYTNKIASVREQIAPLMQSLSIKGADNTGIYDITAAIEHLENNLEKRMPEFYVNSAGEKIAYTPDTFRNSEDYWKEVTDIVNIRRGDATTKGGVRKSLSANTVQLSTSLATAIHNTPQLNDDFLIQSVAKGLNHAAVENLIKTQHLSTDNFPAQLDVEKLFQQRAEIAKGNRKGNIVQNYQKGLKDFLMGMVEVAKDPSRAKDAESLEKILNLEDTLKTKGTSFEDIIDQIVSGDLKNMTNPTYAPTSILDYSKVSAAVAQEGYKADQLASAARDMVSKVHGDNLSILDFKDAVDLNMTKSFNKGFEELFKAAKQNIIENKNPLMMGAAMLAGGAILTQKNPDFSANKSIRADVQASNVAPAMVSNMQAKDNDAALQTQGRTKTEYIRPGTGLEKVKQNYNVNATYSGNEGREAIGAKEAIFGKNITNVNINNNSSYY